MRSPDDHVARLTDGRVIGYAQYGDPNGFPVVSAHGRLACRLDVRAAAPIADQAGIRLISPDRPGIGLSDPLPDRTILDWAHDIGELLDQIDVDRFAAMGWSMGGQYAAALGHRRDAGGDHRRRATADGPGRVRRTSDDGSGVYPDVATHAVVGAAVLRCDPVCGSARPTGMAASRRANSGLPTARSFATKDSTPSLRCRLKRCGTCAVS